MVQLTVRVKPAQKKRKGRNPATGEEITIAAKPASVAPGRSLKPQAVSPQAAVIGALPEASPSAG